jgi:hypothetical protein
VPVDLQPPDQQPLLLPLRHLPPLRHLRQRVIPLALEHLLQPHSPL